MILPHLAVVHSSFIKIQYRHSKILDGPLVIHIMMNIISVVVGGMLFGVGIVLALEKFVLDTGVAIGGGHIQPLPQ
jgi:uncharacterized membrane protein YedE/YeeE